MFACSSQILTLFEKCGVQICTHCSGPVAIFPLYFSLKIVIDVKMTVKKRIF